MHKLYNIASLALLFGVLSHFLVDSADKHSFPKAEPQPPARPSLAALESLACHDTIQVTLDAACQFPLTPELLLTSDFMGCFQASDFLIAVQDLEPSNTNILDGCGYFKFVISVINPKECSDFSICWGYIHAEDKTVPVVEAPEDTVLLLSCAHLDTILNNPASLAITGKATATDNCSNYLFEQFYDELLQSENCDTLVIQRTFNARDEKQNTGYDRQLIKLVRPPVDSVAADSLIILSTNCTADLNAPLDANGNLHPDYTGFPYFINQLGDTVFLKSGVCGLTATYEDQRFDLCPFAYKLQRFWTITDWCSDDRKLIKQIIKVGDVTPPKVSCTADTLFYSTGPFDCTASFDMPVPEVEDACSGYKIEAELYRIREELVVINGVPTPRRDTVFFQSVGYYNRKGYFSGVPVGCYIIKYHVQDSCKNITVANCMICVEDRTPPIAKCVDLIHLSLDNTGFGKLKATEVDEGSEDNCALDSLQVRRVLQYKDPACDTIRGDTTPWLDAVYFNCCDLDEIVTVELKVIDKNGNYNTCWMNVIVEDKAAPECVPPDDITIYCDSLAGLLNPEDTTLLQRFFGQASFFDACGGWVQELTPDNQLNHCGVGELIRSFVAKDSAGNKSAVCEQTVTILEHHNYEIKFPRDYQAVCAEPDADTVEVKEIGCDLLAISREDDKLTTPGESCYKVFRRYRVINWCEYDGQASPVVIERDADCDGLPGDEDVWVLVRPDTVFIDADSTEMNDFPEEGQRPASCDTLPENPEGYWYNSYQVPHIASRGFWQYTQIIKVLDTVPPIVAFDDTLQYCIDRNDCSADVIVSFAVIDECVSGNVEITTYIEESPLVFREYEVNPWRVVGRYPKYLMSGVIPEGRYRVEIRANDHCGNVAVASYHLEVVDCKAPAPICIHGLAAELMPLEAGIDADGDGDTDRAANTVWVDDFIVKGVEDDCSDGITYSINRRGEMPDRNRKSLVLTCDDPPRLNVEIYAWDNADNPYSQQPDSSFGGPNYSYCETYILVQDNLPGLCDSATVMIAGKVATALGNPVERVDLRLSGGSRESTLTGADGSYLLSGLQPGYDFSLRPEKRDDLLQNVSTLDIIHMSKHILGLAPLTSPYQLLAADVNRSGSVSTLDIILLRKAILNIDEESQIMAGWRFIDANYNVQTGGNPLLQSFPEVINFNNLAQDQSNVDFVAVKIGDVSGLLSLRSAGTLPVDVTDQYIPEGTLVEFPVSVQDLQQLEGLQFDLQFNTDYLSIESIRPVIVQAQQLNTALAGRGLIRVAWDQYSVADQALFSNSKVLLTVVLRATQNGYLSDWIWLSKDNFQAEAYPKDGSLAQLKLSWTKTESVSETRVEKAYPNPLNSVLRVPVFLSVGKRVRYEIQNLQGINIIRGEQVLDKGRQELRIETVDGLVPGVYFLRVRIGDEQFVQKLLRL